MLDLVSEIKCLHSALSALGLLPKKLPIPIVRWGGIAWHLLGSHEPLGHAGDSCRAKRRTTRAQSFLGERYWRPVIDA